MRKITLEQEDHLNELIDDFIELVEPKYTKGAQEHGGNLWDMPTDKLISSAMEEIIDMYVYLRTLQQILDKRNGIID